MTSPTAFTATIAPTTRPLPSVMDQEPIPAFIGDRRPSAPRPPSLPTVAPAPAPTFPSETGPSEAAEAAW
jgi:hypothetical protein